MQRASSPSVVVLKLLHPACLMSCSVWCSQPHLARTHSSCVESYLSVMLIFHSKGAIRPGLLDSDFRTLQSFRLKFPVALSFSLQWRGPLFLGSFHLSPLQTAGYSFLLNQCFPDFRHSHANFLTLPPSKIKDVFYFIYFLKPDWGLNPQLWCMGMMF